MNAALAAWEGLARAGTTDWERLRGLAVDVAAGLRRHDEPIVRVQACGVLLRAGQRECADDLRPAVRDVSLPWNLRLLAAKELVSSGAPRATQELSEIASEAVASDPSSALTAMSDADPMAAIATFAAALQGTQNPQTQYQAAYLLGDAGTRSKAAAAKAKETLDGFLAAKPRGPAQTAAVISLARVGGPDQVTELRQVFGTLGGYDKLMAAVALAERGDRTAASSIRSIAATLSEQLQLEAAVRMAPWDRDAAVAMLSTQTRSASPVARLAALQTWPHLKAAPPLAVRTALGDVDPTIRAAAAVAVTSPFAPAGPERRQ
ncbi:MAG TPA: HEAT repeat domain-containing protein [Vicinamibacterales bacterium]|nr:HEAT repeat domain-containing protein [Vicinamibacterales bacterium]